MKALKHLSILLLALCCSYFAKAQCPTAISYSVTLNNVNATTPSNGDAFLFSWFLDGTYVSGPGLDTSHLFQNLATGTHRICYVAYQSNSGTVCDTVCESVTITSCGTLTAQWTDVIGTNDTVRFTAYDTSTVAHHIWNFGDGTNGSGTTATHVYSAPGTYHVCFYSYIPGTVCSDSLCESVVVPASNSCGTASFEYYVLNDSTIRGYSNSTGTNDSSVYEWNIYNSSGTLVQSANTGYTNNFLSNALPAGNYSVCLFLYNGQTQLCNYHCDSVTVLRCSSLTAAWQTGGGSSDTVHFYNSSNPTGSTYAWTFGDGSTSSVANPSHIYTQGGVYTVCLIVSNPALTCKDTLCQSITVGNPNACGVASFNAYILNDSLIHAYSNSTGTTDSSSYVWKVYNSSGALVQSSSTGHTSSFLSNSLAIGTYRLCLDLYNAQGLFCDSFCNSIQVLRCSSLNAQWSYTSSTANDTLKVNAPSNNPSGTTYAWTFGDGSTSSSATVTHVYSQSGVYTVCLIVSNPALTCKDTLCQSVTIGNPNACGTASFNAYILNDSLIHAYSNSTGTSDSSSYVWNVYNASGVLVQSSSTGHTSSFLSNSLAIGTYRLCLDLYNAQGLFCDSFCNSIQVLRCSSLNAQWSYTSSTANDTLKVNAPSNNPSGTTYAWTFGDGSTSSSATVTHVYSQSGVYTVCLIVSNPALTCKDTLCQSVTIGNPNACGTAAFSYYILNDSTIRAYSTSTGTSDSSSYVWNVYGAGQVLLQSSNTGHTSAFLSNSLPAGEYTLCLELYNSQHVLCDSFCAGVQVLRCSSISNTWHFTASASSDTAKFTVPTNNPSGTTYVWTFGDGTSSTTAPSVTHVYSQGGTYTVCLISSNPALTCHDTLCQSVTVGGSNTGCGVASFEYYVLNDSTIRGYSTSTGTTDSSIYVWNIFNANGQLVESDPTGHTYYFLSNGLPIGTYRVCLDLYNGNNVLCDSSCNTIQVLRCSSLSGAWTSHPTSTYSDTIQFLVPTNNPSGTTYVWNFGDGTSSTDPNVPHVYATGGTYNVCLIVSNPALTCHDTLCQSIIVGNPTGCGIAGIDDYIYGDTSIHMYSTSTGVDSTTFYGYIVRNSAGNIVYSTSGYHLTFVPTPALSQGVYSICLYLYSPVGGTLRVCDSACTTAVLGTTCGTASFGDYVYGDTSIHAFSNSTGTTQSTIYYWDVKNANGAQVLSQMSTTNYLITHHLYPGVYTVCLTLYNGNTPCPDSVCNTVTVPIVGACGTASFADTVYPGIGGGAIHAYTTSTSVDSLSQYSWKIWGPNGNLVQTFTGGDFTSSTLDSGTYTVCQYIRATASTYICDSICQTVVVGGGSNPCAGLSAAWTYNLQSNSTDSVEFHGANDPTGTYYRWTFGDGSYNYGQNITHGYATSGTYDVCLVVFNNTNTCRDTVCQNVVITTTTPCPVASFSQYVLSDTIIHAYSTSTGTNSSTGYRWSVTNAAGVIVATGQSTGTTATFYSPGLPNGTYNVCLFVYASGLTFCDSVCNSITISNTINPCSGLNANFTETHLQNGNIQFTPADTAAGVTHYWHFGDGTISNDVDPVHAYATAGYYHVCQYVYYAGSTCLDSFCTNVQAGASGCSANFTYQGYYPPYNGVHFTNTSTSNDSIIAYRWTFGDSTTATFASGDHIFPHSGTWYVCLYIYASNGCSSTYCDSVHVSYDPCYGLSANYTYTYTQSGGVHFAGSTNISGATNLWTFGDGTTSTNSDPVHYYAQGGTYTVCHIISIPGTLCSDTSCQNIQGTGNGTGCVANFTDSAEANNTNTIIFTNTSTSTDSIVTYAWSFGDGSTSSYKNTYHNYANPGTYYVCLTITSVNGCTNTHCDSIVVGAHSTEPCHASFTYTVDSCQVITFTSTSTGDLSFLRWIYGDGTTDTTYHPTHVYAQGGNYTVILHFYGVNCYNFDTAVISVPSCSAPGDTVCGVVFDDLNGNGVQNNGEAGIANAEVHVGSYVTHADSTGHYEVVVPAGTYTIYYCAPTGYSFTIPVHTPLDSANAYTCAAYQSIVVSSGSNCGYNFGIQNNTVTICGTVYFDANDDHTQDNNESGIPNARVVFTDSGHVVYTGYTNQYGQYCAVLPVGTYVITASSSTYPNGVVTPGSITVNATTPGGSYDNNAFGIYVAATGCDLSVTVTPNTTVTPGYPAWYEVGVCNVGSNVTSGVVNLFYDPGLKYNYSSPAATSQNPTTYTASWNVNSLNPGSCQYFYVSFTADSTLVAGQFIFTLASVTTDSCIDANQANNVDTLHQNVTASWDPNNKQVSPAGLGPEGLVADNQWLTYTINFQNTGTAPAVNIVIQDTLSQFLDITTFKMLGASLPYTMQFAGNEAIWKFNAVSLPDSSTDQQGSHGFVSFQILPLQGLPSKTAITNQADIFFDYNAGQATNKTLNTIDYTLSVNQIAADNVTITLQPNPFNQFTTIKIDGTEGPYELNVYDMLGRVVKNQPASGNIINIDRGNLASGMYMYEILHNGSLVGKGKMIAQ